MDLGKLRFQYYKWLFNWLVDPWVFFRNFCIINSCIYCIDMIGSLFFDLNFQDNLIILRDFFHVFLTFFIVIWFSFFWIKAIKYTLAAVFVHWLEIVVHFVISNLILGKHFRWLAFWMIQLCFSCIDQKGAEFFNHLTLRIDFSSLFQLLLNNLSLLFARLHFIRLDKHFHFNYSYFQWSLGWWFSQLIVLIQKLFQQLTVYLKFSIHTFLFIQIHESPCYFYHQFGC